jgi:hypothetical protein
MLRLVALALILLGSLDLAYGGLRYLRADRLELGAAGRFLSTPTVAELPAWAGLAALGLGGLLLLFTAGKRR